MKHNKGQKMKILKLHKKSDGSEIYVAVDKIVAFDALVDSGTRLVFDELFAYQVQESPRDVLIMILGCGRKASQ